MKDTKDKIDKKIFVVIGFGFAYIFIGLSFLIDKGPLNTAKLVAVFLLLFMGVGFVLWSILNKEKKF